VIGDAGTAAALARIPALRPDVAVLDVRLPAGVVTVCSEFTEGAGRARLVVASVAFSGGGHIRCGECFCLALGWASDGQQAGIILFSGLLQAEWLPVP
jgi:hypothetical protein